MAATRASTYEDDRRGGTHYIPDNRLGAWLFSSTAAAWIWLVVRVYLGYEWINAGWPKLFGSEKDAWIGDGSAVRGYMEFATQQLSQGDHPALAYGWYQSFLEWIVDSGAYTTVAWIVAVGEVAVGVALILGAFTGIAAFLGVVMNFSYMFAGSAGVNPLFAILGILLVLAWRNAGYYGAGPLAVAVVRHADAARHDVPWEAGGQTRRSR